MNLTQLNQLRAQLNDADRQIFDQLLQSLADKKEISNLSAEEQKQLQDLISRYRDNADTEFSAEETGTETDFSLPESGFGQYARQLLGRYLNAQFESEEDAFIYAFETRFVPPELKDSEIAAEIFERFLPDIEAANAWRDELVDTQSDPMMAVGLTWFMYVYQMVERLRG